MRLDEVVEAPVVLNFGGGVNSTAMLVEWVRRGLPGPHIVVFGDTGGERPETYAWLNRVDAWLKERGLSGIQVARYRTRTGAFVSLEQHSLDTRRLPSLAYGFKSCSQRFKRDPCLRVVNNWEPARSAWKAGLKVTQLIGYDIDEPHRKVRADERRRAVEEALEKMKAFERGELAEIPPRPDRRALSDFVKFDVRYPLLEWGYDRDDCVEICRDALGEAPPKSSCFFCPANKPREILDLQRKHPELLRRALAIESNAESTAGHTPKLGRYFSWRDVIDGKVRHGVAPEIACECTDGS